MYDVCVVHDVSVKCVSCEASCPIIDSVRRQQQVFGVACIWHGIWWGGAGEPRVRQNGTFYYNVLLSGVSTGHDALFGLSQ